jgi:hypothetical protein
MPIKDIPRPAASEYDAYYRSYIDQVPEGHLMAILEAQLTERAPVLRGLDPALGEHRYAPGKWTLKQVLGHVTDTERIFACRALRMARGEPAPLTGYDQDVYVERGGFEARVLDEMLDEFDHVRRETIRLLRTFSDEMLILDGVADGKRISVRGLGWLMAGHEQHHLRVIRERYL